MLNIGGKTGLFGLLLLHTAFCELYACAAAHEKNPKGRRHYKTLSSDLSENQAFITLLQRKSQLLSEDLTLSCSGEVVILL